MSAALARAISQDGFGDGLVVVCDGLGLGAGVEAGGFGVGLGAGADDDVLDGAGAGPLLELE